MDVDSTTVLKWNRNRTARKPAIRTKFVCIIFRDKVVE
jgi:hypothetical protein